MNPARSLASAIPAQAWAPLWIYWIAPPLGMLLAAQVYVTRHGLARRLLRQAPPRQSEALHLPLPLRGAGGGPPGIHDAEHCARRLPAARLKGAFHGHPLRRHHHRLRCRRRHALPRPRAHRQAHPPPGARRLRAAREGELEHTRRQPGGQVQHEGGLARRGGGRASPPHQLLRRRQHEVLRRGAVPPPPRGLRGAEALGRHLARLADHLRGPGALLHAGGAALPRARRARRRSHRPAGERPVPVTRR